MPCEPALSSKRVEARNGEGPGPARAGPSTVVSPWSLAIAGKGQEFAHDRYSGPRWQVDDDRQPEVGHEKDQRTLT